MSLEVENDLIRVSNQLCDFSADGRFLAIAYQTNLIIKNSKTFDTIHSFIFADIIEVLEWSRNSEYILCANISKAVIQIYSINYPEWKYKLIEGSAGLESVNWSPDSKHILTLSDFNIQASIWSLENQSVTHIQNVKSSFHKLHYSPNGSRLAIVVSIEGQDSIEIYKTDTWKLSRKLICGHLNSIDGICWSPNSELLCIWCSFGNETKLITYSSVLDRDIGIFCPTKITDSFETEHSYQNQLNGIETVTWMPSGQLLAVTGFNEVITLLNYVTWKPLLQLYLDPVIKENYLNKVYEERVIQTKFSNTNTSLYNKHILEEKHERPVNVRISKRNDIDKLSIAKFSILEFSSCGHYLAIKHELYPTTLWIWNIIEDYLDYLLLENSIAAVKWNPRSAHLLIFCKCTHMFEWTPYSATCIPTPRNIIALDARWHPQGNLVLLCGYNKAIIYEIK
ncbi:WD repeat-containing protein WRAP73-like, partial [Colletes gigas]|uniref:WD repeat-containing protein WRAP73-like n=1 Tax=Colletes gigas TaxID=935657 RepID=UPI001C9A5C10